MSRSFAGPATVLLLLAGCTGPALEGPAPLADDGEQLFPLLPGHIRVDDARDVILAINVLGPGEVPIEIMFSNTTPVPDAAAHSWAFHALPDGQGRWTGHTYFWGDWEAVSVTTGGGRVGAGPAIDPLVNEILWGNDYSTMQWTETLQPGRYYGLAGVNRAAADFRLSVSDADRDRIRISVVAVEVDAIDTRVSFNPDDFDEMTQVYTPRAFLLEVSHTIRIREEFNWRILRRKSR